MRERAGLVLCTLLLTAKLEAIIYESIWRGKSAAREVLTCYSSEKEVLILITDKSEKVGITDRITFNIH